MKTIIKAIIKAVAENTGYIFFAIVIASIIIRILQVISKYLF